MLLKCQPIMQYQKACHIYITLFIVLFRNGVNSAPKLRFLSYFQRFLVCTLLRPVSYAQIFCQMKVLIKIHNPGKFHHYAISGSPVRDFQMFRQGQKVQFLAASWWFFKDYSPKLSRIRTKFSPVTHCKETHHIYYGFF